MKKYIGIAIALCLLIGVSAFALTRGENKLLSESNITEIPCDGVTLTVSATHSEVEYTIESSTVDYIVYDGYNDSMRLEMLRDGKWYKVQATGKSHDEPAAVSPNNSHTVRLKWKDVYKYNMESGQYRLVYTFWAMDKSKGHPPVESDSYVVIQEFVIQ
ncbi:MAG: hypothetical protein IJ002_00175 [Clostridia bacterium]|nr:hypothetical protein [Clostridia bacterium]